MRPRLSAARTSVALLAGSLHPRAHWHPSSFYASVLSAPDRPAHARGTYRHPPRTPIKPTAKKHIPAGKHPARPRKYLPLFPCESPAALVSGYPPSPEKQLSMRPARQILFMHLLLSSARASVAPEKRLSMRTALFHTAALSAARASVALLAGSLHPRAHLHPSSFHAAAPVRRPTIPRTCGACRHPPLPYKTRRKNPSLRENIWPPCPPPAPPLPSLRKASIRGRIGTLRLSMRPYCPRPTVPRTLAGRTAIPRAPL